MKTTQYLFLLARANNIDGLKTQLESDISKINDKDSDGNTLLHIAAKNGNYEFAKYLVENGANIHAQNNISIRPLALAVKEKQNGYSKIVTMLIESGALINHIDKNYRSALSYAVINNDLEVVNTLIANKANVNLFPLNYPKDMREYLFNTPLKLAENNYNGKGDGNYSKPRRQERAKEIYNVLKLKVENTPKDDRDVMFSPLHIAVWQGKLDKVKEALASGVDVNSACRHGYGNRIEKLTPLHLAYIQDNKDIIDFLIKHGADTEINAGDKKPHEYKDISNIEQIKQGIEKSMQHDLASKPKKLLESPDAAPAIYTNQSLAV